MELNSQYLKGKWAEMKGEIQKAWGKVTHDELEQTKGDMTSIKGLIQQKYGKAENDLDARLGKIADKYSEKREQVAETVKSYLKEDPSQA